MLGSGSERVSLLVFWCIHPCICMSVNVFLCVCGCVCRGMCVCVHECAVPFYFCFKPFEEKGMMGKERGVAVSPEGRSTAVAYYRQSVVMRGSDTRGSIFQTLLCL